MRASPSLAGHHPDHPLLSRDRLLRLAEANAAVLVFGLAIGLVVADYVTGIEIAITLLYAAPIALAAWWRGRTLALSVAALCVAGATMVDVSLRAKHGWHLQHPWTMAWNYGASFALFTIFALLLVRLRAYADQEAGARRATVEQLRQADRLAVVGKLASGLAHELGTPLNIIIGHAEIVDSDRATPAVIHSSSQTIIAQAKHMASIIRGLLDFSRQARGERSSVNLDALARDAAKLLDPVAAKREVSLSVEVDHDKPVRVRGNRTELEQVLVNLLMNGIQATSPGGKLRVRVRAPRPTDLDEAASITPPPRCACVEVEDEGSGIAPEVLPNIFDPFFTTKGVGEGTGLGLSVSYGIVSEHGGRIEVASKIGEGSVFSVYLPLARAS